MAGTSIDGIDAALARIEGRGLVMRAALIRHISHPLGELATPLRQAAEQQPMTAGDFAHMAWRFGLLHAETIAELLSLSVAGEQRPDNADTSTEGAQGNSMRFPHPRPLSEQKSQVDLICVHGQTVFHQPPLSWQLINPAPIAARFGCAVVSDLRQADLAAGGQGAPITPLADWILFRSQHVRRAIVNLGGFCNITVLPRDSCPPQAGTSACEPSTALEAIRGFDACACNQVLDAVAREALGTPFDADGRAARNGIAQPRAVEALRELLTQQHTHGRSLGTGDEAIQWVRSHRGALSPNDLAASAVQAIAQGIADCLRQQQCDEAIVAGGGARNHALLDAIRMHAAIPIHTSDAFGVPIEAREALAFAVLGALCADGVPVTLPQVTGCKAPAPLAGVWTVPGGVGRGLPPAAGGNL